MHFFLTSFGLRLQMQLRKIRTWGILLLLPFLVFTIQTALPADAAAAPVQVGVALPESGGEAFWSMLESRSGTVLTFIAADTQTIDRNVATGKWDCGLILPEDFQVRLEEMDTDRIFTVRIGEGSAVYPLVQETVSACMATLLRGTIAEEYMASSGFLDVQELSVAELDAGSRVQIRMSAPDGGSVTVPALTESGVRTILLWGVGAVMLIWLLLSSAEHGKQLASAGFKRMHSLRSATAVLGACISADVLIMSLSGFICMLILGTGLTGCLAVLMYNLFIGCTGILFARIPAVWKTIPVWPPFLLVMSLLLTGTLVELPAVVPALRYIAPWIPGRLFQVLCRGELYAAALLFIMAIPPVLISLGLDHYKKNRCTK